MDEIEEMILVMKQRERDYMDRINQNTIVFASILITILFGTVVALRVGMGFSGPPCPSIPRTGTCRFQPMVLAVLTVVALLPFQICFYLVTLPPTRRSAEFPWLPDFIKNAPSWEFDDIEVHMEESIVNACADASAIASQPSVFDNAWPTT